MDCLAITKLDVLDELEEIKVCVAYDQRSTLQKNFLATPAASLIAPSTKPCRGGNNQLIAAP